MLQTNSIKKRTIMILQEITFNVQWILECVYGAGFKKASHLSRTGELHTGHSTQSVPSPVLNRGGGSPPSTCWQCFSSCSPGYC